MARAFDFMTPLGSSVGNIVFQPLDQQAFIPTVVDGGARNGMLELPASYARRANFVGFEPNPAEFEKLRTGTTDAAKAGYSGPAFRSTTYHPTALWSTSEQRRFFITSGAGACTLMGEANPGMTRNIFLDSNKGTSYAEMHTDVKSTVPVDCRPLDTLLPHDARVDYLKIDVEGAEYDVLKGAKALFDARAILFIKTEFVFTPYYSRHPLLGHQQAFLDDMGLRLIDIDLNHSRYSRSRTRVSAGADRRLIYAGDAFFVLDPDRNALSPVDLQRLAAISLVFGFNSFGISLLRDAALLSGAEIDAVEQAVSRIPLPIRLKQLWQQVPYSVYRALLRSGLQPPLG